ncbi:M3 family oligoendopeptidase [Clostridium sp. BJN0001]|uniref:M3 family oligoendopeptidase n=1 Tax=Clostridium sp. BJN0001 TaxID=2930219 RepID=UPI001FD3C8B4|nr:M3 family oligoendopeptidase [Clostridium sp. BJN0001]
MNRKWSLDSLYKSFSDEKFLNDIKLLDKKEEEFKKCCLELNNEGKSDYLKLEEYLKCKISLYSILQNLKFFSNLSLSADTNNDEASKYNDKIEKKLMNIISIDSLAAKFIGSIKDIDKVINKSKMLKEHEFILKEQHDKNKYMLKEREEKIISQMKSTGSKSFEKLFNKVISNHKVLMDDSYYLLGDIQNMAYDEKEETRKKAYEAELKSYENIEDIIAMCLNSIKGESIEECKIRGYKSPLYKTLIDSRFDEETLNIMLDVMKENFDLFRKYLRRKGEILGHKDGLPFYDLYAPIIKNSKKYTFYEAASFVVKCFNSFNKKLGDYAKHAIDNNWIDVYPREGKVLGAFCENLIAIGESRFLLNFGENFSDVVTLAHELGHGFHGECLKGESILNTDYSMPIAETASTFCESIVKEKALENADKNEKISILDADLSDAAQVIVDIYSRFIFEKSVFELRKEGPLNASTINEIMIKAQKESYGDGLCKDYMNKYMWIYKPHYYDGDYHYYNFPYAFGFMFSNGLYMKYKNNKEGFFEKYTSLLKVTGKNNIYDTAKIAGIDLHNREFFESAMNNVKEKVNLFIKLTERMD